MGLVYKMPKSKSSLINNAKQKDGRKPKSPRESRSTERMHLSRWIHGINEWDSIALEEARGTSNLSLKQLW